MTIQFCIECNFSKSIHLNYSTSFYSKLLLIFCCYKTADYKHSGVWGHYTCTMHSVLSINIWRYKMEYIFIIQIMVELYKNQN